MAKTSKRVARRIAAKISKVMKDDPGLSRAQALGKAFGILRQQGVPVGPAPRKRRKKRRGKRK